MTLRDFIKVAEENKVALSHFNISDIAALRAIFSVAQEINLPVIIGVSEGEREYMGTKQVASLVKSLRDEFEYPIYLNADHTHSLDKVKEAVEAGFDAVIFDGSKLTLEENIKATKEAVDWVRSQKKEVIVEGELGYIGTSSQILKDIPEGAAVKAKDMTRVEDAKRFVEETGVDLFSPAVGNIHGMFADAPNPDLDIQRIKAIKEGVKVPLVLHGGSGIKDDDFKAAIDAGISIVHINTEIRLAWRRGMVEGLAKNPDEVAPYKIYPSAEEAIKDVVFSRMSLFAKIGI